MDYEREYAFVIKYLNKLSIKTALIHIYPELFMKI